jgi:signal transduction histidine kinase
MEAGSDMPLASGVRWRRLGRDLGQALAFGLVAVAMGRIRFQLPGLAGGLGDLGEIAIIVSTFHLRAWWLPLIASVMVAFNAPPDGFLGSTLAMHALGATAAWFAARWLRDRVYHLVLLGLFWIAFVVCIYYALIAVPIFVLNRVLLGLVPWAEILGKYGGVLHSLLFEIVATALVTAVYLVNLRLQELRGKAQASLRDSEARLAGILATAPVGLALVRDGRIAWANERLAGMVGGEAGALVGTRREALLVPIPGGLTEDGGQFSLARADGGSLVTLVKVAAMPGEASGTCTLSVLDITDQAQMEQQLRHAQKLEALGQMAASIAHDFGNLLQVVHLSASSLGAALEEGRPAQPCLAGMNQAVDQGRRVVGQLLAFSRNQRTPPLAMDLGALVERTAPMLRTLLGGDLPFSVRVDPGLPTIYAEPGQVEQVLVNLVLNGRDALRDRPDGPRTLTVEVKAGEPGAVVLSVTDTGTGMDEATCKRVFEPFFTTKAAGRGTGLGLATVFAIVKNHGGSIALHSALGEGTAFSIAWPQKGPA